MRQPYRLLFVCMGNICRSPAAEAIMHHLICQQGLQDKIQIDSAGTGAWHAGNPPDQRMTHHSQLRGYTMQSRARQVTPADLQENDLVLIMDPQNLRDIQEFDPNQQHAAKIRFITDYCTKHDDKQVPDPYYGGDQGFEHVLDLLEDACSNLLQHTKSQWPQD